MDVRLTSFLDSVGCDESGFITKIVKEVSRKHYYAPLANEDHLAGLDDPLEELCSLMDMKSDSVLKIGIFGMTCVGKTTLARAVYNRIAHQFEGDCFLDVKGSGLVCLQNRLLFDIVGEDIQIESADRGLLKTLVIKKCHFSNAPKHLPSSLRVLQWWNYPSQKLPCDVDSKQLVILWISQDKGVALALLTELFMTYQIICKVRVETQMVMLSTMLFSFYYFPIQKLLILTRLPDISKALQTCKRAARVMLQASVRVLQAEVTWRLVGLVSSVVGLLCYALSPSFNQLIGGWNSFKMVLYAMFSLVIGATILFGKKSSLSVQYVEYKTYMKFAVLMIVSVYSFYYDNAVAGKPELLSVVSNAALALMSLSLSRLVKLGFEIGIFSYFLGCLVIQLWTIDGKLILVAIIFGCPLFIMQSSLDSEPEVCNGSQVINSDSQTVLTNGGQDIHPNSQTVLTNGGQDIHSSSNVTP